MNLDTALGTIARHLAAHLIASASDCWESYPEIGEDDWNKIVELAIDQVPPIEDELYLQAYTILVARAGVGLEGGEPNA